ncbi:sensor histidine kinase [Spirosoma sp. KUDC1026]|uniref:sensor histidine kinase n=1 Tax=Spirosoma sp. KUDC1026 TaxID=2745947 RepID=UPI00159BB9B1|nr:histidine kinase [Spirosoma sp. KUDC1026]QKZ15402.1 histidine kinase [Spirosoma sp. KUDC1026]
MKFPAIQLPFLTPSIRRILLHGIIISTLYVLVSADGLSAGLTYQYGTIGRWYTYGQFLLQLLIYYGWGYWLFPRYLYRFRPVSLLAIILLSYTIAYLANYAGFAWLHQTVNFPDNTPILPFRANFWSNTVTMWHRMEQHGPLGLFANASLFGWNFLLSFTYPSLLLAFKGLYDNMSSQVNNAQLKEQNMQLELNYLKSQINPHFLFNVLNSVYSLTEEDCPPAAQLVHQLSGLMQYTLYETTEPTVPLQKELQFIRDYIALEKIRTGKRADIQVSLPETVDERVQIVPFLLIPFVENAFKHGVQRSARKSWVNLTVAVNETALQLTISNSKPAMPEASVGGLGLTNVQKRLNLLYPAHSLRVTNDLDQYSVDLTLPFVA